MGVKNNFKFKQSPNNVTAASYVISTKDETQKKESPRA